jgi:hypothetical protein
MRTLKPPWDESIPAGTAYQPPATQTSRRQRRPTAVTVRIVSTAEIEPDGREMFERELGQFMHRLSSLQVWQTTQRRQSSPASD